MSNSNQSMVLTNTVQIKSVSELIIASPNLQSDYMGEFFAKLDLPQNSLGGSISVSAGSRNLTLKLMAEFADKAVRPFAYFENEYGKVVILSAAHINGEWGLFTLVEGQNYSMFNGILVQIQKLNAHPEFLKFLDFADHKLNNIDFRSENTETIEGGQEFTLTLKSSTYKFHGRLISSNELDDVYEVFLSHGVKMKYIHSKAKNAFVIDSDDMFCGAKI